MLTKGQEIQGRRSPMYCFVTVRFGIQVRVLALMQLLQAQFTSGVSCWKIEVALTILTHCESMAVTLNCLKVIESITAHNNVIAAFTDPYVTDRGPC